MEEYPEGPERGFEPEERESSLPFRRWWRALQDFWRETVVARLRRTPRGRVAEEGRSATALAVRAPYLPAHPLPDREEIARWVTLLGHPNDPAHSRALDELVVIGQPAVPVLIEALQSETWIQVFRASEALGLIGDRRAVGPLKQLLDHANSNVRWGAAEALGRIQSRWARARLRRVAHEDESRTSWGETVAEAAERAVASIDRTWVSWLINVVQILFYLALCAAVVYGAVWAVRQRLEQRVVEIPTPTPTVTVTVTPSPSPTPTPLPPFVPIPGVISNAVANVRDRPDTATGTVIGVLHYGDEVLVYGGHFTVQGDWWYLVRLEKINNPETFSEVLENGAYGWVAASLVGGVESPEIAPTMGALETMRAAESTPTPIGSSLDLPTPTAMPTVTITPTVTVSP